MKQTDQGPARRFHLFSPAGKRKKGKAYLVWRELTEAVRMLDTAGPLGEKVDFVRFSYMPHSWRE